MLPVEDGPGQLETPVPPTRRVAKQLRVEHDAGPAVRAQRYRVGLVADVVLRRLVGAWILRLADRDAGRDHGSVVHLQPLLRFRSFRALVRGFPVNALIDPGAQDPYLLIGEPAAVQGHQQHLIDAGHQVDQTAGGAVAGLDRGQTGVAAAHGPLLPPQAVAVHRHVFAVAAVAALGQDRLDVPLELDLPIHRRGELLRRGEGWDRSQREGRDPVARRGGSRGCHGSDLPSPQ